MMSSAIAHHPPTDPQLVPEQRSPTPTPPSLYTGHDVTWYGIPLWPLGSAVLAVSPPNFLCPSSLSCWLGTRSWKILDYSLNTT